MGTANPFYKNQELTHKAESRLFTHTLNRIELSGFEHFLFLMTPPKKNTQTDSLISTNYPNEFIESFKASNLEHENPIEKHCKTSITPLIWDQTLFSETPRLWQSSQLHGLNYGWSFSIRDGNGVISILSMTRRNTPITPQESNDKVANLLWLCHELHSALHDTVHPYVKINETIGRLSLRESEILNWTAKGKTASDIAMILNLTTRTVNFHISSAIRKMGASNKTAAVVTAAKCGLI